MANLLLVFKFHYALAKYLPLPHPMLYDCSQGFPKTNYNIDRGSEVGKEWGGGGGGGGGRGNLGPYRNKMGPKMTMCQHF